MSKIKRREYMRKWRRDNPDKGRRKDTWKRNWEKRNPEKAKECGRKANKKWRENNKDYFIKWRKNNPDKMKVYIKKYQQKPEVKEKIKEYMTKWRKKNGR